MNNKAIIGIMAVLILVVLASGCTSTSGNQFTTKDSSGKEMSFTIPDGWAFSEDAPGVVVSGETNKTNHTAVTISKLPANGASLEDLKHNTTYIKTGKIVSEVTRTVDGVQAYEITTDQMAGVLIGKIGEAKDIVFVKDGNVYKISFFTGETLQQIQQDIDTIVNSFKST